MSNTDGFHLGGGLTDDELHYFNTGGDVNENLAKSAPDLPVVQDAPPIAPDQAGIQDRGAAPAAPDARGNEDPGDDPIVAGEDLPRRISRNKFLAEQNARRDLERQLNERNVTQARLEERLTLLSQALQPAAEDPAKAPKKAERPDPNTDIFAYIQWMEERHNEIAQKVTDYEQQIQVGQQEMTEQNRYINSMNKYAANEPNFVQAYGYLLRARAAELMAPRYPQATVEQLWQAEIPDDIGEMIRAEERDLYKTAFQNERNPAAEIFRMAQLRGFRAPVQSQMESEPAPGAKANGNQRPGTALGGAPPNPRNVSQVQSQVTSHPAPTATNLVEAIKRGQPAAQSLGNVSGNSLPPQLNELTSEQLANMSEEEFAQVYNRLQANGGNAQLRALMGN